MTDTDRFKISDGWSLVPGDDARYVQVASFAPAAAAATELHHIREAIADDATCCRCSDPILVGEQIHTVTVTAPDGTVTHRQATHLRHLRG